VFLLLPPHRLVALFEMREKIAQGLTHFLETPT